MLGDAIPTVVLSEVLASLGVAYESPKLHEPTDLLTTAHAYSSRQLSTWVRGIPWGVLMVSSRDGNLIPLSCDIVLPLNIRMLADKNDARKRP